MPKQPEWTLDKFDERCAMLRHSVDEALRKGRPLEARQLCDRFLGEWEDAQDHADDQKAVEG